MKYRQLGNTGLNVSEIGFGGEWLSRHPEDESIELIRYAGRQGINIIDCWMPDEFSRRIIGKAIHENRQDWIIQGHLGSVLRNGQSDKSRDLKDVIPAFESMLKDMDTPYIDIGMIFFMDSMADWEEAHQTGFMDYLKEQKRLGRIRHIGMSTHNPRMGKLAAESGLVEMILFSTNPAFDMLPASEDITTMFADEFDISLSGIDPDRAEFYKTCVEKGVGITVMKPFAGGRLFDAARSPFGVSLTPIQCIHYVLNRPAVCAAMCGYDTKEQIDAAVAYETAADDEKDYASVLAHAPRHSYNGQCTYCTHCKPCPAQLDIAAINKYYDLATMQPEVPGTVRSHYLSLPHTASECLGCRACESRCPFGVKIFERMQKTATLFGK